MGARVTRALARGAPVVALESSVFAQGLPQPANAEAASRMIAAIEREGAVPAVTGVVRGTAVVGLERRDLERFLQRVGVHKVSARDLAPATTRGLDGATTVAGAVALARLAGISVFATGGIGGVHHGEGHDESADLLELSRIPMVVVCSGAKAILDIPATAERLESLGITVVGFGTDRLPAFYAGSTDLPVSVRVDAAGEVAAMFAAHARLERPGALLVVQPAPPAAALPRAVVERAVSRALRHAARDGVSGAAVTPYLLQAVERATRGRSVAANLALLERNAGLAAEIAVALAAAGNNR